MRKSEIVAAYADDLRQCEHCHIWFVPKERVPGRARFCSDSCRVTHWQTEKREQQSEGS